MFDWNMAAHCLVSWVATYAVHSTVILGCTAVLLVLFGRRRHLLTNRLWKAAMVSGCLTATVQLAMAEPDLNQPLVRQKLLKTDVPPPTRPASDVEKQSDWKVTVSVESPHVISDTKANEPTAVAPPTSTIQAGGKERVAFAANLLRDDAWVSVGAATIVAFWLAILLLEVHRIWSCWKRLSAYDAVESRKCAKLLAQILKQTATKRSIALLQGPPSIPPFAFGILRPTIVLPQGIENELTDSQLRALIGHEVAHIVRADLFWMSLARVLCRLFPLQPLNWCASRRIEQSAEFLSDRWAVGQGVARHRLAETLTRVAEISMASRHAAPRVVAAPATGNAAVLIRRVEELVSTQAIPSHWNLVRRLAFTLLVVLGFGGVMVAAPVVRYWPAEADELARSTLAGAQIPGSPSSLDEQIERMNQDIARLTALLDGHSDAQLNNAAESIQRRSQQISKQFEVFKSKQSKEWE